MADRPQDRPGLSDGEYDRRDLQSLPKSEADPLAELARLIGQTDPFANFGRGNPTHPLRSGSRDPQPAGARDRDTVDHDGDHDAPDRDKDEERPTQPPWMQHLVAQQPVADEPSQEDFNARPHPLQRFAASHRASDLPDHESPPVVGDAEPAYAADGRYDEALYGHADAGQTPHYGSDPQADDPYLYPDGYADDPGIEKKDSRRGGLIKVAAVLALAVVGTSGAFAYRTYVSSPRTSEPPVIKADVTPIKVVPPTAPADTTGKLIQDRLATGTAAEKLVSREEQPVDVKDPTKAGARAVFPPVNPASGAPAAAATSPAKAGGGVANADEPRKIRTFAVKGDQSEIAAMPAAKPAPRTTASATRPSASPAANANASANAPLSLSPQPSAPTDSRTRVASASAPSGGYVVQVSSQRNEADAQASYRALQGKFPSVLGSRQPVIKRADLGDKGVFYRALVGPFSNPEEAGQICGSLKTAGGQCVVQKN